MGANKRIFNERSIMKAWKKNKMKGVKDLIGKTDIYICEDSFSTEVMTLLMSGNKIKARHLCSLNR